MKIQTKKNKSSVHGRILTTYLWSEGESDRELHEKLGELMKGKNVVGYSFFGRNGSFDVKRKWYQL